MRRRHKTARGSAIQPVGADSAHKIRSKQVPGVGYFMQVAEASFEKIKVQFFGKLASATSTRQDIAALLSAHAIILPRSYCT